MISAEIITLEGHETLQASTSPQFSTSSNIMVKRGKSICNLIFEKRRIAKSDDFVNMPKPGSGATLFHALVVIFLEYFAWGLLTVPVINVLADTFPSNKFLMNGLILGVKGLLSFLSAPLVGAMSDVYGRKKFLLLTVFATCMPIPVLKISPWWYFTLFTLSGFFAVTFSVVLAYVADITEKHDRPTACGLVSATFAASLVTSPALGAWISKAYSDDAVVLLASIVFALDLLFIVLFVSESLPQKARAANSEMSWQSADPLQTLRIVAEDGTILKLAGVVFLSYLPEAGQFSCFFVYLKLVVGFSPEAVAGYIALVGILSVFAQTGILLMITKACGSKHTITIGLCFQFLQLIFYGLGTQNWVMWTAGILAAMSQLSYPSISAFVSLQTDKDLQGTVQGVLTGIRGLCQGFGPAIFGFIFYMFGMDLTEDSDSAGHIGVGPQFPVPNIRPQPFDHIISPNRNESVVEKPTFDISIIPGPPFLLGALMVFLALLVNTTLPSSLNGKKLLSMRISSTTSSPRNSSSDTTLLIDEKD
uniref:Major facilitator superfamily (MFS) profile domain-containing protein n=1 Tax=Panagrolaimus sp. PS1159 TaxID=55785 RepID=A0AC35G676_9BILA